MTAYIAFIATLNLCIGYALGVYIGVMPGISPRRREADQADDDPIELAVPEPAAPAAEPAPAPVAAQPEPVEAQATAPEPAVEAPADPAPAAEETPEVVVAETETEPEDEVEPTPTSTKPDYNNILAGLNDFKAKIDAVSSKLNDASADRETIDEVASDLKQANSEYLEQAEEALGSIDDGADAESARVQQTLQTQSESVQQANQDIDEIVAEPDVEVVREKLLESSEQLAASAAEAADSVQQAAEAGLEEPDLAPAAVGDTVAPSPTSLRQIDDLLELIGEHLPDQGEEQPLQIAALAFTQGDADGEHLQRLLSGVEQIVSNELDDGQSFAVDEAGRLLLVLSGDDSQRAAQRCERLRQQVAATTFRRNGEDLQAAICCGLTDTTDVVDYDEVLRRITESLAESNNMPEPRTMRHDGKAAAVVQVDGMSVSAQMLEI